MNGIIIKLISNDYTVLSEGKLYVCKSRGKFRNLNISPVVGDHVIFDSKNNYILEIKKRKNYLVRPPVSNIDDCFIITSVKNPDLDLYLLDKMINLVEFNNIKPVICFSKLDLKYDEKIKSIISYYKNIGYKVFRNDELNSIKQEFENKVVVFTGQSGAGKSTLLNKLNSNLNIKTGEISYALGRGKHTTRHVELIPMFNGLIADTPGFSNLEFYDMTKEDIRDNFIEFEKLKECCKYRDCMHNKEDDCEIKRKVEDGTILKSRYENYINFIEKG